MTAVEYDWDYPREPIGGGNPYYRCSSCGISAPTINGQINKHASWCEYRISKESAAQKAKPNLGRKS